MGRVLRFHMRAGRGILLFLGLLGMAGLFGAWGLSVLAGENAPAKSAHSFQIERSMPAYEVDAAFPNDADVDDDGFTDQQEMNYLFLYSSDLVAPEAFIYHDLWTHLAELYPPFENGDALEAWFACVPKTTVRVQIEGQGSIAGFSQEFGATRVSEEEGPATQPYQLWKRDFAKYNDFCSNTCDFDSDCSPALIRFKAVPATGWALGGWGLDATGTRGNEVWLDMESERIIYVRFVPRPGMDSLNLVADLEALLPAIGVSAQALNTFDINGSNGGNDIPDAAEFAMLQKVLQSPLVCVPTPGAVDPEPVWCAWQHNVEELMWELPDFSDQECRAIAAYMTLGDYWSVHAIAYMITVHAIDPDECDSQGRYTYDRSAQIFFDEKEDIDADGLLNIEEWIRSDGDRALFIQYALDGNASAPPPAQGG